MQRIGEDVAEKLDYQLGMFTVERRLKRRVGRWANKRKKTLYGSKVPDLIYLPQAQWH